ncbi:hypothetical protein ACVDG5_034025 [Mesorhizobium sp. ORM6]
MRDALFSRREIGAEAGLGPKRSTSSGESGGLFVIVICPSARLKQLNTRADFVICHSQLCDKFRQFMFAYHSQRLWSAKSL